MLQNCDTRKILLGRKYPTDYKGISVIFLIKPQSRGDVDSDDMLVNAMVQSSSFPKCFAIRSATFNFFLRYSSRSSLTPLCISLKLRFRLSTSATSRFTLRSSSISFCSVSSTSPLTRLRVVKGSGRGAQHQQQQPGQDQLKPNDQERRKGRERCSLVARAGLASYLCRLCTLCVHPSVLGGDIHPHHSVEHHQDQRRSAFVRPLQMQAVRICPCPSPMWAIKRSNDFTL